MTKLEKRITRETKAILGGHFGTDRGKTILVTLVPGHTADQDLLELRPKGTRRPERIRILDVYEIALRLRANREHLEKARKRKELLKERRARRRLDRMERKLRKNI